MTWAVRILIMMSKNIRESITIMIMYIVFVIWRFSSFWLAVYRTQYGFGFFFAAESQKKKRTWKKKICGVNRWEHGFWHSVRAYCIKIGVFALGESTCSSKKTWGLPVTAMLKKGSYILTKLSFWWHFCLPKYYGMWTFIQRFQPHLCFWTL